MADRKYDQLIALLKQATGSSVMWKLDTNDLIKLGKSLWLSVKGAVLLSLLAVLTELIPQIPNAMDWGIWTGLIGIACTFTMNVVTRLYTNYKKKIDPLVKELDPKD